MISNAMAMNYMGLAGEGPENTRLDKPGLAARSEYSRLSRTGLGQFHATATAADTGIKGPTLKVRIGRSVRVALDPEFGKLPASFITSKGALVTHSPIVRQTLVALAQKLSTRHDDNSAAAKAFAEIVVNSIKFVTEDRKILNADAVTALATRDLFSGEQSLTMSEAELKAQDFIRAVNELT